MAVIISNEAVSLFISYGPGTGSTALEQHLRTHQSHFKTMGLCMEHFPAEEFGINSNVSRHICYAEFVEVYGRSCKYVATGVRNPFSYYFSEYRRILKKWVLLLDDPHSWIFKKASDSTRKLALAAKMAIDFNAWMYAILVEAKVKGYLSINEDHMNMATHFIRTENMNDSFDMLMEDVFGVKVIKYIGNFPIVNATIRDKDYSGEIESTTLYLALEIFGDYMGRFGYSFQDSGLSCKSYPDVVIQSQPPNDNQINSSKTNNWVLGAIDRGRSNSTLGCQSVPLLQTLTDQVNLVQTADGPMHIFKSDPIFGVALKTSGAFHTDKVDEVLAFLKQRFVFTPDLFVDIGANIGTHLVHALKCGGFLRGLAFEPDPNNFAVLTQNIAAAGFADKVQAFKLALSARSGSATFELCGSNFGDHRVRSEGGAPFDSFGESQRKVISVLTDTGDDFFGENGLTLSSKTLMWVNTQGHDGHIFTGFRKLFSKSEKPFLVCEFWPYGLERAGGKEMFYNFLRNCIVFYDISQENWQEKPEIDLDRLDAMYQSMLSAARDGYYPHTDILCVI